MRAVESNLSWIRWLRIGFELDTNLWESLSWSSARPQIEETADGAKAVFVIDLPLVPDRAAPLTYRIHCDAVLRSEGGEWKIHSLSERGEQR